MRRTIAASSLLLGICLLPTLQGCVPIVAAGATTGALATLDRRTLGAQTEDEAIEWKARARTNERFGDKVQTSFTSYNRRVLISGEAPSEEIKAEIERIVSGVPQVQGVFNEISIAPLSSFSNRSNDSYITTRVKTRLVDARKLNPIHVKVVTEAGIVYLLGLVTQPEADAAIQIARTTKEVKKVVTLFEIISAGKASELAPQTGEPAKPTSAPGSGA
jgi:osmotically-inducible protein OsmY